MIIVPLLESSASGKEKMIQFLDIVKTQPESTIELFKMRAKCFYNLTFFYDAVIVGYLAISIWKHLLDEVVFHTNLEQASWNKRCNDIIHLEILCELYTKRRTNSTRILVSYFPNC